MATNFPGFSTQGPILSVFESSGNFSKSMFFSFEMVSKFKLSGLKSLICELKSLIFPFLSGIQSQIFLVRACRAFVVDNVGKVVGKSFTNA